MTTQQYTHRSGELADICCQWFECSDKLLDYNNRKVAVIFEEELVSYILGKPKPESRRKATILGYVQDYKKPTDNPDIAITTVDTIEAENEQTDLERLVLASGFKGEISFL